MGSSPQKPFLATWHLATAKHWPPCKMQQEYKWNLHLSKVTTSKGNLWVCKWPFPPDKPFHPQQDQQGGKISITMVKPCSGPGEQQCKTPCTVAVGETPFVWVPKRRQDIGFPMTKIKAVYPRIYFSLGNDEQLGRPKLRHL